MFKRNKELTFAVSLSLVIFIVEQILMLCLPWTLF